MIHNYIYNVTGTYKSTFIGFSQYKPPSPNLLESLSINLFNNKLCGSFSIQYYLK